MTNFIKISDRAAFLMVLAAAVIAWAVLAPSSFQATANAALDALPELPNIQVEVGG